MLDRIIDETAPRCLGPLPKPRGLLPVPTEIAEEVGRDQVTPQPNFSDVYAKLTHDDWTLRYSYEDEMVACRITPVGIEMLAVGPDQVGRCYEGTPQEERQGVVICNP
jgi:hypothetical protein